MHPLATMVHAYAHYVITPFINDPTLLASLATICLDQPIVEDANPQRPINHYIQLVQDVIKQRQLLNAALPQWHIVPHAAHNMAPADISMGTHSVLSISRGLSEHACYAALHAQGLTMAETLQTPALVQEEMAHVIARKELRRLLQQIGLPLKNQVTST